MVFNTSACSSPILFSTIGIWSTRTWRAGSWNFNRIILSNFYALCKRIACISRLTEAHCWVTHNFALSIWTTAIWARIFTLKIYASQMTRTFRITDTFRLAVWWISNHSFQTWTWFLITINSALSVRATRWRLTRVRWWRLLNSLNLTSWKGITSISRGAAAYRIMVYDLTSRTDATCSRTRISAFLIATCFILRTFIACDTLRSTCWRASNISWYTRTHSLSIDFTTLRIRTTGRWLTWICFNRCWIERK